MTKKVLVMGVILTLFLSMQAYSFAAADDQTAIELDGTKIKAAAYIDEGNIYLPLRAVSEALGYKVRWSGKDNPISVSKTGENIMIDLKNYTITANDHTYYMSGDYLDNAANKDTTAENTIYMRANFFSENLALKTQWDKSNEKVKLEKTTENKITIKTIKEASENEEIKMTLQYPQINGLPDQAVQENINSVFKKAADTTRNEGLQNADEMKKDMASGYSGSPNKCESYFDYKLKYNQNGLLSLIFLDYQYTGGAHGMTLQSSYTFDLKTGKAYNLQDLFNSDADYVLYISNIVGNRITEGVKEGILYELTPFQAIKDDQDFYLSDNAAVVYFQQYEYFPYAAGIQEFPIDFSTLQDMLKPDFGFLK